MLYRSTDRLCRCGAPVENLAHSASFHSGEKTAPSKPGIKHLAGLPKGMKPIRPGELVQIDALFVNVAPDKAVKRLTASARSRSGPSPSSPAAQPRAAPQPSSTSSSPRSRSASRASKSMAGRSSGPSSRTHAESATCASSSCRRSGLSSKSNSPKARGDTSSTASKTSRPASNRSEFVRKS